MARKIVFTSGKGGTGKTTVVCNVGYRLAKKGKRVLIFDFDFVLGGADILLKIDSKGKSTLSDVMMGNCRPSQVLLACPQERNLQYLPASFSVDTLPLPTVSMVVRFYEEAFDYILIDCPSGLGSNFFQAISEAEEAVVVSTLSPLSLRAADKTITLLKNGNFAKISLLLNQVKGNEIVCGATLSPTEASALLKLPLTSVLPFAADYAAFPSEEKGYKLAADALDMGEVKLLDVTLPYKGVRGLFRRSGAEV